MIINLALKQVFFLGLILGGIIGGLSVYAVTSDSIKPLDENPSLYQVPNKRLVMSSYIFDLIVPENQFYRILEQPKFLRNVAAEIMPRPELRNFYTEISPSNSPQNTIAIFPKFTEAAYNQPGFYDYFRGECDERCLTVKIGDYPPHYTASKNAFKVLNLLGYNFISDVDFAKNPSIINNYNKVIILHNEYVTQEMFDSLNSHPKVIYLYPNALYARVNYDQSSNTITLIRGHAYPDTSINNGFDWEFENTHPYEYDTDCNKWEFYEIDNGFMLNCYPEFAILKDKTLLRTLKDL